MYQTSNSKQDSGNHYDLEQRTERFAKDCRLFIKTLPRTITNIEDAKQLARSSGSVAANYIEANEALSKKDFIHRLRISRKEAKESRLWLRLIDTRSIQESEKERKKLEQEADELLKILSSIIDKSE